MVNSIHKYYLVLIAIVVDIFCVIQLQAQAYELPQSLELTQQENQVYTWQIEPLYENNENHQNQKKLTLIFKDLSRSGFRIISVSEDTLFIQIKNINAWKRFLKRKKNSIHIENDKMPVGFAKQQIMVQQAKGKNRKQVRRFKKYLRKVKRKNLYTGTVWKLGLAGVDQRDFHIDFYRKDQAVARLSFIMVEATLASELEELEDATCEPVNRRIWGFGDSQNYLMNMNYRAYRPRSQISIRKNWTLYFDHNSSKYNPSDINSIIKYMLDSNLLIRSARINAYASVEGDRTNNLKLQQDRAEILITTFEKVNDEKIEAEIITSENWELFFTQLQEKGWHEFICLDTATIKKMLVNKSIRSRYEPMLSKQRKADLYLRMSKRLTLEERIDRMFEDYEKAHIKFLQLSRVQNSARGDRRKRRLSYIREMLAIKEYARKMVDRGIFDQTILDNLYHECLSEMNLADFYNFRKKINEGHNINRDLLQEVLLRAYEQSKNLENEMVINTRDPNFRHSMRILQFSFDLIEKGELHEDFIYQFQYPNYPGYSFLNVAKQSFMDDRGITEQAKIPFATREWFDHPQVRYYYQIIKQLAGVIVENEKLKITSRNDWYYQLDIWEFVWFNVNYWEPKTGLLYDEEITPEHMDHLVDRMFRENENVCPDQLYQVALTFHIKMLNYRNAKGKFDKFTFKSYKFIRNYYNSRIEKLDAQLGGRVYESLLTFNKYRFYNESARDAAKFEASFEKSHRSVLSPGF